MKNGNKSITVAQALLLATLISLFVTGILGVVFADTTQYEATLRPVYFGEVNLTDEQFEQLEAKASDMITLPWFVYMSAAICALLSCATAVATILKFVGAVKHVKSSGQAADSDTPSDSSAKPAAKRDRKTSAPRATRTFDVKDINAAND